jgi:hypothetical protein
VNDVLCNMLNRFSSSTLTTSSFSSAPSKNMNSRPK